MVFDRISLLGLVVVIALSGVCRGEDAPEPRLKEILAKKKAGQELTAQEQEFLEQNAHLAKKANRAEEKGGRKFDRMVQEVGPGLGPQQGPQAPPGDRELRELLMRLNVVDRAALMAGREFWQAGKHDDAVAMAEKTAGATPDAEAAGVARLMIGRWQAETDKEDEAGKSLRAVTGRAAALAMVDLAEPLLRARDLPGLLAAFRDLVATQKNSLDRCRVAKALLDLLDRPMPEGLNAEQRGELLKAIATCIPYEDALAAKDELAKEQVVPPPPPPPMQQGFGPPNQNPGAMGGGPPGLPPEMQERFRALREMPPEQRRDAIAVFMKDVEKQVDQLEAAGRKDEANRLRELLDRHRQVEARMKEMGKGRGKGMEPPHRNPEEVKAEIKRLEDQGFKDEANKLRKELEETEKGKAVDEKF